MQREKLWALKKEKHIDVLEFSFWLSFSVLCSVTEFSMVDERAWRGEERREISSQHYGQAPLDKRCLHRTWGTWIGSETVWGVCCKGVLLAWLWQEAHWCKLHWRHGPRHGQKCPWLLNSHSVLLECSIAPTSLKAAFLLLSCISQMGEQVGLLPTFCTLPDIHSDFLRGYQSLCGQF